MELLVTSIVIAIAFTAIIGLIYAAITISDYHRKAARSETLLRTYAEEVKSRDVAYVPCAGTGDVPTFSSPEPDYLGEVLEVQYWTGATTGTLESQFDGTCGTDQGAQRIHLRVRSTTGSRDAAEDVWIVKRDTCDDVTSTVC